MRCPLFRSKIIYYLANWYSSFPVLVLCLRMPRRVKLRLEQIQKYFLWGGSSLEKKLHVKWATVCSNKEEGGLGFRGFYNLNRALMSKWLWHFPNKRDSLWRKVINSKFGEVSGGWFSCNAHGSYWTRVWKEIRKEWESCFPSIMCSLGNGRRVWF